MHIDNQADEDNRFSGSETAPPPPQMKRQSRRGNKLVSENGPHQFHKNLTIPTFRANTFECSKFIMPIDCQIQRPPSNDIDELNPINQDTSISTGSERIRRQKVTMKLHQRSSSINLKNMKSKITFMLHKASNRLPRSLLFLTLYAVIFIAVSSASQTQAFNLLLSPSSSSSSGAQAPGPIVSPRQDDDKQDLSRRSSNEISPPSGGTGASSSSSSSQDSIVASLSSAVASAAAAAAVAAAQNGLSGGDARSLAHSSSSNIANHQRNVASHSSRASQGLNLALKFADAIPEVPYNILHNMKKVDHAAPFYNVPNKLTGGVGKESSHGLLSMALSNSASLGGAAEQLSSLFRSPLWKRIADGYGEFTSEFRSLFRAPNTMKGPTSSTAKLLRDISVPALLMLAAATLPTEWRPVRTRRKSLQLPSVAAPPNDLSATSPLASSSGISPLVNSMGANAMSSSIPDSMIASAADLSGYSILPVPNMARLSQYATGPGVAEQAMTQAQAQMAATTLSQAQAQAQAQELSYLSNKKLTNLQEAEGFPVQPLAMNQAANRLSDMSLLTNGKNGNNVMAAQTATLRHDQQVASSTNVLDNIYQPQLQSQSQSLQQPLQSQQILQQSQQATSIRRIGELSPSAKDVATSARSEALSGNQMQAKAMSSSHEGRSKGLFSSLTSSLANVGQTKLMNRIMDANSGLGLPGDTSASTGGNALSKLLNSYRTMSQGSDGKMMSSARSSGGDGNGGSSISGSISSGSERNKLNDKHRYSLLSGTDDVSDLEHFLNINEQKLSPSSSKPFLLSAMTHAITSMFNPKMQQSRPPNESGSSSSSAPLASFGANKPFLLRQLGMDSNQRSQAVAAAPNIGNQKVATVTTFNEDYGPIAAERSDHSIGDRTINQKAFRRMNEPTLVMEERELKQLLPQALRDIVKRTVNSVQQTASNQWRSIEGQLTNWVQDKLTKALPQANASSSSSSSSSSPSSPSQSSSSSSPAASSPSSSSESSQTATQTSSSSSATPVSNIIATVGSAALNILGIRGSKRQTPGNASQTASAVSSDLVASGSSPAPVDSAVSNQTGNGSKGKHDHHQAQPNRSLKDTLVGVADIIVSSLTNRQAGQSQSSSAGIAPSKSNEGSSSSAVVQQTSSDSSSSKSNSNSNSSSKNNSS